MALHRFAFRAMAAEHELLLDAPDESAAARAAQAAIADVARIEAKYSRYRDDSVTSAINRAAGAPAPVPIDAETAALLRYADQCHAQSDGAFDITSGVLRRAWDFRRVPPRVPDAAEVDALCALIGWSRVEWSDDAIRLPEAGMQIDFGGIGKEYAADRAATMLAQHGVRHALVNLGGDVRALGTQPGGAPWRVGVVHPRKPDAAIGGFTVADGAVATSGDYERYFEVEGRRYSHILDARSGWPVDHWQSASVVAPVCTLAGTLATLAMLRPDADAFLRASGCQFLLVDKKGRLVAA
jgi:thiamine biosynthesis lipoprotein